MQEPPVPHVDNTLLNYILWAGGAIIATLSGVVSMFFKMNEKKNEKNIAILEERVKKAEEGQEQCEQDRRAITARLEALELCHHPKEEK